ncbi:MAG TPA: metal-dependent transcriptional regulator, partial [Candidatus Ozemobacteraceae bacterium]|nr:metal-dependent transcriptional regulator [Candidatus Ozemobacteraceae bacterium]
GVNLPASPAEPVRKGKGVMGSAPKTTEDRNRVKKALSVTLESYLEEICALQERFGAVRITDLAERMGCRLPTATSAVRRLAKLELINYESYRPVTLTEKGQATVRELTSRHKVIADFLQNVLAFPGPVSQQEACRLEHRIGSRILRRLRLYMLFLRDRPVAVEALQKRTRKFSSFVRQRARKSGSGRPT